MQRRISSVFAGRSFTPCVCLRAASLHLMSADFVTLLAPDQPYQKLSNSYQNCHN